MKKIIYITIVIVTYLLTNIHVKGNSYDTSRDLLRYEITSIYFTENNLIVEGWALLKNAQHFQDQNTHVFGLEVFGNDISKTYWENGSSNDLTSLFYYSGTPYCSGNKTWTESSVCNYYYRNTAFRFYIPITDFEQNNGYNLNLLIHGYTINQSYKVPIYAPMKTIVGLRKKNTLYQAISNIDDSKVRVMNTQIYVRPNPADTTNYYYSGLDCSATFKNTLYYQENSIYENIFEKQLINGLSYYKLSGQIGSCNGPRREVMEGQWLQNMWIPSVYVDYLGTQLKVYNSYIGTPPILQILEEPTIQKGEQFIWRNYVSAFDKEDGDLTSKIELISSNFIDEVGVYSIDVAVSDSDGERDQKQYTVRVIDLSNTPPSILAQDLTIKRKSVYEALQYAKANDKEDGNLTTNLTFSTTVNTTKIGIYETIYYVCDSELFCVNKKVKVEVIENVRKYRFISLTKPFYKEEIPEIWSTNLERLENELHSTNSYFTINIKEKED